MTDVMDDFVAPAAPGEASAALTAQLLDQILAKAHPLLAEGFYLAALSRSYDVALLAALRARDDGRDERLVARLAQFSFIKSLDTAAGAEGGTAARYAMKTNERQILIERWIAADPQAFVVAHRRALAFWEAAPHPDRFVQDQTRLYHLLVADGRAGLDHLAATFRAYAGERWLAAVDRLLLTAVEVRSYLAALGANWLDELDDWLAYLGARLAQYRGQWAESRAALEALHGKPALSPGLAAYVARAYGMALTRMGLYVEALDQYQLALAAFDQQSEGEAERAFTEINLGDAYVELAISARGYRQMIPPESGRWRRWLDGLLSLRALLPLIVYLSLNFGWSVWRPSFWPALQEQDWIIARLFVTGARWYRRARRRLRALADAGADRVQADEKLAFLYLTMGDAARAAPLFEALLKERAAPLGEYRRGRVRLGLGHALLRLGRSEAALEQFERALPVAHAYEDLELAAQLQGLLAEALFRLERYEEALNQFGQAMRLYQQQDDVVGATEIAERLRELGQDARLDARARATASTTTQNLTRRQYLVRFQHPALVFFRRAALVLLALFIFLVPMLSIHVETGSVVLAGIHFVPSPLLAPDPDYTPTLSQGVALNVQTVFRPDVAGQLALALLLFYLLAYALLGVALIARTRLRTVQAARAEAVRMDLRGLAAGEGATASVVGWSQMRRLLRADVTFWGDISADNSTFAVQGGGASLTVQGATAWYSALQARVRASLPGGVQVVDLSYRLLCSRLGALYLLGIVALVAFVLLGRWAAPLLAADWPGLPYSLADFYPYLYLALFLPPLWWIVVRPIQIQLCFDPRSRCVWWVMGAGLVLAALRGLTWGRPWLVRPDIYPALAVMVLLGSAAASLWAAPQARGGRAYAPWLRLPLTLLLVAVMAGAGYVVWREAAAYHHLIAGNAQRDRAQQARQAGEEELAAWLLEGAVAAYERVLALAPHDATALNSRAVVLAQLGQYEAAVAGYEQALAQDEAAEQGHLNRALAYVDWGLALQEANETDAARHKFDAALADLDRAIALQPQNADVYLLRGVVHHAQGAAEAAQVDYQRVLARHAASAPALLGQGWLLYQQADGLSEQAAEVESAVQKARLEALAEETFGRALQSFQQAAQYAPHSPEVWIAVGYGHFALEDYPATMAAWERAIALSPDEPLTIISHGMGNWLMADAGRCFDAQVAPEEKQEVIARLNLAIDDLNRALALRPGDDWTYRTRAQIEYLLSFCPVPDPADELRRAIASYDEALKYAPDDDFYWLFRGRVVFELGRYIFRRQPENEAEAWVALAIARADIEHAYRLNPDDATIQLWRDYLAGEAWGRYHQVRGWDYYVAGRHALAEADSVKAALLLPDDAELAFNVGLAALAQGKAGRAAGWYGEGLERASALEDWAAHVGAVGVGRDDLAALLEAQPSLRWLGDPLLGLLYRRLAEAYDAAGDYFAAGEAFAQAARLRPQDAEAALRAGMLAYVQGVSLPPVGWYRLGLE